MRRYSVTLGAAADIIAELDRAGTDRTAHGKPDRAAEYARAIAAIEAGGDGTEVVIGEHALYRIGGPARPRRQYMTVEDSRERVLAELRRWQEMYAGTERDGDFDGAIAAIEYGAVAVHVDGIRYHVVSEASGR